jgi:tetratricopeptide (TPR) repeat protein
MPYVEIYNAIHRWHGELRRSLSGPEIIQALERRLEQEQDPETSEIVRSALAREHIAQGNKAAAKALFEDDPVSRIHRWELLLRRRRSDLVRAVERRIGKETGAKELQALRMILAEEHCMRRNYASAEALYLQVFDEDQDTPWPLLHLASLKAHLENKPDAAMVLIDRALEATHRTGLFRRYVLGSKARLALDREQYALVEDILKQIMALTFTPGNTDVNAERDFFDRLPPGSIDPEVARRYEEYCQAHNRHKPPPAT